MAIIKCKECSSNISNKAVACPKCGAELLKGKTRGALTTIIISGVLIVLTFFTMGALFSTNKYERAAFERSINNSRNAVDQLNSLTGR
jgi:hypothetical protein